MRPSASADQPDPTPAPHRLRGITGGYDISRWPIQVHPLPPESAASWVMRVAHRYGTTARRILAEAAKHFAEQPINEQNYGDLAAALGLEAVPAAPHPDTFCPRCLAEDGCWRSRPSSPVAVACERHRVLLLDCCPACGKPPHGKQTWLSSGGLPTQCSRRRPSPAGARRRVRPHCNFDLSAATDLVMADETLLAGQHSLHEALAGFHPATVIVDQDVSPADLAQAAEALLAISGFPAKKDHATRSTTESLRALQVTYRALREATTAPFWGTHLELLLNDPRAVGAILGGQYDPFDIRCTFLPSLWIRQHRDRLSTDLHLAWRSHRDLPFAPWMPYSGSTPANGPTVSPAWVPQLIWPEHAYPGMTSPIDRALTSMCLLHVGRQNRWADNALELHLNAQLQYRVGGRFAALRRDGWGNFARYLDTLIDALCADPPPVNYRARRLLASQPETLTEALTATARDGARSTPGVVTSFWQALTGGSPGVDSQTWSITTDDAAPMRDWFEAAQSLLVRKYGPELDGPLWWHPP